MNNEPVSLEDRQKAVDTCLQKLSEAAIKWVEARAKGLVAADLDARVKAAEREYGKALSRLRETRKRLGTSSS